MKHIVYLLILGLLGCTGGSGGESPSAPERFKLVVSKNQYVTLSGDLNCSKNEVKCEILVEKGSIVSFFVIPEETHEVISEYCVNDLCKITINEDFFLSLSATPKNLEAVNFVQEVINPLTEQKINTFGETSFDITLGSTLRSSWAFNFNATIDLYRDLNCQNLYSNMSLNFLPRYSSITNDPDLYYKIKNLYTSSECRKVPLFTYTSKYKIINKKIEMAQLEPKQTRYCSISGPTTDTPLWQSHKYGQYHNTKSTLITSEDLCAELRGTSNAGGFFGIFNCLLNVDVNYSMLEAEILYRNPNYKVNFNERCIDYDPNTLSMVLKTLPLKQTSGRIDFFKSFNTLKYMAMENFDLRLDLAKTKPYWLMKFNNGLNTIEPEMFEGSKIQIFNLNPFVEFDNKLFFIGSKEGEEEFSIFKVDSSGNIQRKVMSRDLYKLFKVNENMIMLVKGDDSISFLNKTEFHNIWSFGQQPGLNLVKKDYLGADFSNLVNGSIKEDKIVFLGRNNLSVYILNYQTKDLLEYFVPNSFRKLSIISTNSDKVIVYDGKDMFKLESNYFIKMNSESLEGFSFNFNFEKIIIPFDKNYLIKFNPDDDLFEKIPYFRISHQFSEGKMKIVKESNFTTFSDLKTGLNDVGVLYSSSLEEGFDNSFLKTNSFEYVGSTFDPLVQPLGGLFYPGNIPHNQQRSLNVYKNGIDYFITNKNRHYLLMRKKGSVVQKLATLCDRSLSVDSDLTINMFDLSENKILINLPECTQDSVSSHQEGEFGYIIYEEIE